MDRFSTVSLITGVICAAPNYDKWTRKKMKQPVAIAQLSPRATLPWAPQLTSEPIISLYVDPTSLNVMSPSPPFTRVRSTDTPHARIFICVSAASETALRKLWGVCGRFGVSALGDCHTFGRKRVSSTPQKF
ncbi:hypothetical protein CCACVL1_09963 [Corchorus capsularis]|uniref:Uncharacterized protein n=1 Tax=Corchorus capsularis TaxID=210143 RepID=A0A1R3ITF9_COCAP|nr:hypothetical protein CCACVL1_09963 [Corchorus capsularis]